MRTTAQYRPVEQILVLGAEVFGAEVFLSTWE